MKIALRIALGVVLTVVVLLAAGVAALFLLDWNVLKPRLESFASDAAGREVTVENLDVDLGWTTHIRLRELTLANPHWVRADPAPDDGETVDESEEPSEETGPADGHLLRIAELRLSLEVEPLLGGDIVIREIVATEPEIRLVRDAEGRSNWNLDEPAETAGEIVAPEERDEFPVIGRLEIVDGLFGYRNAERELDLDGTVSTAEGDAAGSDALELALEGSLEGRLLRVDLVSGSVASLRESDAPFPIDLDVRLGETALLVEGTMREPIALEGLDLALTVEGPDLSVTFPILGIPLPETPPYRLTGALKRDGDVWRFESFDGTVGDSDLSGSLKLDQGGEKPYLQAELVSRTLDFDDLAGFIGAEPDPQETASEEQRQEAAAEEGDGSIFPDEPIQDERLHAMNMDVHFLGQQVIAEALPIEQLDLTFHLKEGRLLVKPFSANVAEGKVSGEVALNARQEVPSADADLTFQGLDLKPFFRDTQFVQEMDGRFTGHVYLLGVGQSLDAMMQTARGDGWIGMSQGSLSGLLVEAAGLDVVEALVLYVGEDARVPIRCARFDLDADSGVVTVSRAIVDTMDSVVLARGTADLGAEQVNLQIEARAKDFSLIDMAAPVSVSGRFEDPSIGIGGLDPLPFLELGDADDVDCERLLSGDYDVEEVEGAGEGLTRGR